MTKPDEATITFYDNFVPGLTAAEYELSVEQRLVIKDGDPKPKGIEPLPPTSQRFIVKAPRFRLSPADVHRLFPPPNGTGLYHEYLPSVVFNKRSVPWERALKGVSDDVYPPPWMNLLVLTPEQLSGWQQGADDGSRAPAQAGTRRMTLATLLEPDSSVRAPRLYKPTQGEEKKSGKGWTALEDDEEPSSTTVDVIEMSADAFRELVPSFAESPYLGHVRQVSCQGDKEQRLIAHDGWHSVLMANRFAIPPSPTDTRRRQIPNLAHIVSVEGFEDLLDVPAGQQPSLPAEVKRVRMISLFSWAFYCVQDPAENFAEMMRQLIGERSRKATNLLLRMPPADGPKAGDDGSKTDDDGSKLVKARIDAGYVALEYWHRDRQRSFAWYRGPLVPVPTSRFLAPADPGREMNRQTPLSATEAMIFDRESGLFDQSYAAAWAIGRTLALANQPFAVNLLQWRREAHAVVDLLLERIRSYDPLGQDGKSLLDRKKVLTPNGVADLRKLIDDNLVSDAFRGYLAEDFARKVARSIGRPGDFTAADETDKRTESALLKAHHQTEHRHLTDLLHDPDVVALLNELSGLEKKPDGSYEPRILSRQVIEWLARLSLLHGVPLNYLLPDERMLPNESIRFFYVDDNWIEALLDGALSLSIQSSRDSLFQRLTRDKLHRAAERVVHRVRDKFSGASTSGSTDTPPDAPGRGPRTAGFLLRSSVVAGWPGLEVLGWYRAASPRSAAEDGLRKMRPLRYERLAPHLLLCIFPQVPVRIELNEPSEGLVFGTEDFGIEVRAVDGAADRKGHTLAGLQPPSERRGDDSRYAVALQDIPRTAAGVLRILGEDGLKKKLEALLPDHPNLGPAALAVQLVRVPEQMRFHVPKPAAGGH